LVKTPAALPCRTPVKRSPRCATDRIDETTAIPALGPGFGGERHEAALVVKPGDLPSTNPFFLMADDHVTTAGPFGEAHPHAGLETVTFMLGGSWRTGRRAWRKATSSG
jgi:redox-sensitive bicupin YhaK (pirin superfamily)